MEIWSSHYIILLFKECSNFSQSPEAGKKKKTEKLSAFYFPSEVIYPLLVASSCWPACKYPLVFPEPLAHHDHPRANMSLEIPAVT